MLFPPSVGDFQIYTSAYPPARSELQASEWVGTGVRPQAPCQGPGLRGHCVRTPAGRQADTRAGGWEGAADTALALTSTCAGDRDMARTDARADGPLERVGAAERTLPGRRKPRPEWGRGRERGRPLGAGTGLPRCRGGPRRWPRAARATGRHSRGDHTRGHRLLTPRNPEVRGSFCAVSASHE